jgi:hypothetical protein
VLQHANCTYLEEIMKRLGIIVAISLSLPAFGQGVDPLIGTWKLNLEKSTSIGIPLNRSGTITSIAEGQNFIDTVEGIDAQGQPYKAVYQHTYDGMPHPTTGNANYDATTYTRIGNTINGVRFKQGKTVEVTQLVIVPGKTLTGTNEGIAANGQPYHQVLVFDRQ